jgi:hypothetical protein
MLRLLIGTGILLVVVGFGAAGWQYWQGLPAGEASETAAEAEAPGQRTASQTWLISATGGLVPRDDVRAYLRQDRFVPSRTVTVTRTAPLGDLLAEGEKLPDPPYLQVLADIRAPRIGQALCPVLAERVAQTCAVNSARVVEGSVDPVRGTAQFRIELVYRLKPEAEDLPDLAANVLEDSYVTLDLSAAEGGTAEAALAAAVDAASAACTAEGVGQNCRILGLALDLSPDGTPAARARIAWLVPLPEGMFIAPPLDTPTEG